MSSGLVGRSNFVSNDCGIDHTPPAVFSNMQIGNLLRSMYTTEIQAVSDKDLRQKDSFRSKYHPIVYGSCFETKAA